VATTELEEFSTTYQECWLGRMKAKLGLVRAEADDADLVGELLGTMDAQDVDFTTLFRRLADAARGDVDAARAMFEDPGPFESWLDRWLARLGREDEDAPTRADRMDRVNPVYIPRNHKVQEALDAATGSDFEPFRTLLDVLQHPFERREGLEAYEVRAPDGFGPYRTFCGT
jgi:uncharacterized protein YdiU (UPF0061 family)